MPKDYVEAGVKRRKRLIGKGERERRRKERRAQTQKWLKREKDRKRESERNMITEEVLEIVGEKVEDFASKLFRNHCRDVPQGITSQLLSQNSMSPSTSLENLLPLESVCDSQMVSVTMMD